jgi:hypothetical protein
VTNCYCLLVRPEKCVSLKQSISQKSAIWSHLKTPWCHHPSQIGHGGCKKRPPQSSMAYIWQHQKQWLKSYLMFSCCRVDLPGTDWQLVSTSDGKKYYYNNRTKVTLICLSLNFMISAIFLFPLPFSSNTCYLGCIKSFDTTLPVLSCYYLLYLLLPRLFFRMALLLPHLVMPFSSVI